MPHSPSFVPFSWMCLDLMTNKQKISYTTTHFSLSIEALDSGLRLLIILEICIGHVFTCSICKPWSFSEKIENLSVF